MARFTTALAAAAVAALSLATAAAANSYTVVTPTAAPTAAPLSPVCHTKTTKCCWTPYVCNVQYKVKHVRVEAVCQRKVKVRVPCYTSRVSGSAGHDDAAVYGASTRFFTKRCYAHQVETYACSKERTVKEAYPVLCYKKACKTSAVPARFVAPSSAVLTAEATAVPAAVPARHNRKAVKALFGKLAASLLAKLDKGSHNSHNGNDS